MRKTIFLLLTTALFFSCQNENNSATATADSEAGSSASGSKKEVRLKRYQVPSGVVEYKIDINGNMGVGRVSGHGVSKLYFKDWGAVELQEEQFEQTTAIKMFGQNQVQKDKTHKMSKLDNGVSYSVDFKAKKIYKMQDPAMGFFKSFAKGDVAGSVEEMMKSMGAKKTGTEKILGYPCDVWDMNGVKIWMYKGVPLKSATNIGGIKYVSEAVKAEFGGKVPEKYFRLPDYPITDNPMFGAIGGEDFKKDMLQATDGKVLNYKEFKAEILKDSPDMPEEYIKQAYHAYKQMNGK